MRRRVVSNRGQRRVVATVLLVSVVVATTGCQRIGDLVREGVPGETDHGTAATDVDESPPPLVIDDIETMRLTTPTTDAGQRPVLAWEAVDDAATYHVTVFDHHGDAYWAWTTSDTSVVLGGFADVPDDATRGPRLVGPSQWHVLARDVDGDVIAQSGLRPIEP